MAAAVFISGRQEYGIGHTERREIHRDLAEFYSRICHGHDSCELDAFRSRLGRSPGRGSFSVKLSPVCPFHLECSPRRVGSVPGLNQPSLLWIRRRLDIELRESATLVKS